MNEQRAEDRGRKTEDRGQIDLILEPRPAVVQYGAMALQARGIWETAC